MWFSTTPAVMALDIQNQMILGMKRCYNIGLHPPYTPAQVPISPNQLWDPTSPCLNVPNLEDQITGLLNAIGMVLSEEATLETPAHPNPHMILPPVLLQGSQAFARPPAIMQHGFLKPSSKCMLMDEGKVSNCRKRVPGRVQYISMPPNDCGYAWVYLAKTPLHVWNGWPKARCHQIICWCCWGPPPVSLQQPVVMHWCERNR
jgi:hypothetical protein